MKKIFTQIGNNIQAFMESYDVEAWPAFLMFLVVVSLGMGLNWMVMRKIVGDFLAILISLLFEAGIVAWKVQSWRKKNNETQQEIVNWATWLSVILALGMLVTNLFRAAGDTNTLMWVGNLIIGTTAFLHVAFYLLFDMNDTQKEFKRKQKADDYKVQDREHHSTHIIKILKADMDIIRKITDELKSINDLNEDLPIEMREPVLEAARKRLLQEYNASENVANATQGLSDLNHDGVIGKKNKPQIRRPFPDDPPAYHPHSFDDEPADTPFTVTIPEPPHFYTIDQLLLVMHIDRANAMQWAANIGDADKAYQVLKSQDRLPKDITADNFASLFSQLNPT